MTKCDNKIEINGEWYTKEQELNDEDFVIVRTYSAGVHIGTLKEEDGKRVVLENSRRVYYWSGAMTLSQLALEGTKSPEDCKITVEVPKIILTEAIEIIPCTEEATKNLKGVFVWKK